MRRTSLPLLPPLPQMLFWLKVFFFFFFSFNGEKSSQQNEINYLTNRGTQESRGWGAYSLLAQSLLARCCRGGLGKEPCSCLQACGSLFSPINCRFQDYQSSGFGVWLWFIAVWQRSLIRSPEHDSKVIQIKSRQNPSRVHNTTEYDTAAKATKISPILIFYI